MENKPRYRFTKKEKLKSRKQIDHLFATGKSFSNFPLRVVWATGAGDTGLQVGVTASTRYFKKAVDRNRVKRLMREAIRLQKNELQQLLQEKKLTLRVFLIYQSNELPLHEEIFKKTGKIIQRLEKMLHEDTQ